MNPPPPPKKKMNKDNSYVNVHYVSFYQGASAACVGHGEDSNVTDRCVYW